MLSDGHARRELAERATTLSPLAALGEVADYHREQTLLGRPDKPDRTKGPAVAAGRTAATSSRLLYEVIAGVYDWLGFDAVDDLVFRDLVIARIVEPTSKLDALRVLADLGADRLSYKTIQRHLQLVNSGKYRDLIAEKSSPTPMTVVG